MTCETCKHWNSDRKFNAVVLPPNGMILPEKQYNAHIASGALPPGLAGVVKCTMSMCTVFPKHEPTPSEHFCGQWAAQYDG